MLRPPLAIAALAAALLVALAVAPAARADDELLSMIQDDNQFVYGTDQQRETALGAARTMGADGVRVTVLWKAVAAHTRKRIKRAHLPASYPAGQWDRYDELVKSATARGLRVYLNITGPGPAWAHARTRDRDNRDTWKPNPREFGRFARAVATRYSGTYRDENNGGSVLPRVSFWSIYNEPNQGGWLTPQSARYRGVRGAVPASPHIYRKLLLAGADALKRTGHAGDVVLFGELAPIGVAPSGASRPLRPGLFVRELFCLDGRLRRYRGRQADVRGCGNVRRLRVLRDFTALGFGHHPYTRRLKPTKRFKGRDSISMANVAALPRLLDRIARRTRLIKPGLPVYLTEFGYETNPPDTLHGISPQLASEYENLGDYLAYRHPRIKSQTHFQLFDVPPLTEFKVGSRGYWRTYQSGLLFQDGQPKLVAYAWSMPLVILKKSGRTFNVWGGLRFMDNGRASQVQLQFRRPGQGYVNSGAPINVTSPFNFYETTRDIPAGTTIWRALWTGPNGETLTSREVEVR